ncbi:hypothetical protein [Vibrio astriarenae]|uniref:hypothetical protein n=1 Tax=Vibrio astriarenae TaxID=1481923 RepID=UPI003734EEFD
MKALTMVFLTTSLAQFPLMALANDEPYDTAQYGDTIHATRFEITTTDDYHIMDVDPRNPNFEDQKIPKAFKSFNPRIKICGKYHTQGGLDHEAYMMSFDLGMNNQGKKYWNSDTIVITSDKPCHIEHYEIKAYGTDDRFRLNAFKKMTMAELLQYRASLEQQESSLSNDVEEGDDQYTYVEEEQYTYVDDEGNTYLEEEMH